MSIRWSITDPRGRRVCLSDEAWSKILVKHLAYEEDRWASDMQDAIRDPLMSHELARTAHSAARWGYEFCSTSPPHRGNLILVAVERRRRGCDQITSAYLLAKVHRDALTPGAKVEIDRRPRHEDPERPCGDPRVTRPGWEIGGMLSPKTVAALRRLAEEPEASGT